MRTVEWVRGKVRMIDQRQLPWELAYCEFDNYHAVAKAIKDMVIRGAPAIGAAAAFGLVLGAFQSDNTTPELFLEDITDAANVLTLARPTAVNLVWALRRVQRAAASVEGGDVSEMRNAMVREAESLANED